MSRPCNSSNNAVRQKRKKEARVSLSHNIFPSSLKISGGESTDITKKKT
jgi:hypothetical protein